MDIRLCPCFGHHFLYSSWYSAVFWISENNVVKTLINVSAVSEQDEVKDLFCFSNHPKARRLGATRSWEKTQNRWPQLTTEILHTMWWQAQYINWEESWPHCLDTWNGHQSLGTAYGNCIVHHLLCIFKYYIIISGFPSIFVLPKCLHLNPWILLPLPFPPVLSPFYWGRKWEGIWVVFQDLPA